MKCVACREKDATTKKFVRVDVETHDPREPLLIQQIDVCDDCYGRIERGELPVTVKPDNK